MYLITELDTMDMESQLNVEARLARLEHFMEYVVEELLPQMNENNARLFAMAETVATIGGANATLLQNVAIITMGKEEFDELRNDDSFKQELEEGIMMTRQMVKEQALNASEAQKLKTMLGKLAEAMSGLEPNEDMCSQCDDEDCDERRSPFRG
jgi:hypothetical protein